MKTILFILTLSAIVASCSSPENQVVEQTNKENVKFKKLSENELSALKNETNSILEANYLCQENLINGKKACITRDFFTNEYPSLYCGIVGDDSLYFFTSIRDSKAFAHTHFSIEVGGKSYSSQENKMMIDNLDMNYNEGKVYEECYHDEISCKRIIDVLKKSDDNVVLKLHNTSSSQDYKLSKEDLIKIKNTIELHEKLRLISLNESAK